MLKVFVVIWRDQVRLDGSWLQWRQLGDVVAAVASRLDDRPLGMHVPFAHGNGIRWPLAQLLCCDNGK